MAVVLLFAELMEPLLDERRNAALLHTYLCVPSARQQSPPAGQSFTHFAAHVVKLFRPR